MNLELKMADANNVDFAWSLFSPFVQQNLFSGAPGRRLPEDWNEGVERVNFQSYWNEGNKYVITIDDVVVGWTAIVKDKGKVLIENWFTSSDWQNKNIAAIILGDLVPKWRGEGLKVEAHVLKNAPMTAAAENLLLKLGFTAEATMMRAI